MDLDYEKLREDLIDYFGTAMIYNPMAVIDISNVESASDFKLEQIAIQNGFDLNAYEKQNRR